jgi:hypothetical protein
VIVSADEPGWIDTNKIGFLRLALGECSVAYVAADSTARKYCLVELAPKGEP